MSPPSGSSRSTRASPSSVRRLSSAATDAIDAHPMGRTDSRRRSLVLLILFATVGSALLARLAYWQVGERQRLADQAFQQTSIRETTPSKRGEIFDRSGTVVLATTIERQMLISNPSEIDSVTRRAV